MQETAKRPPGQCIPQHECLHGDEVWGAAAVLTFSPSEQHFVDEWYEALPTVSKLNSRLSSTYDSFTECERSCSPKQHWNGSVHSRYTAPVRYRFAHLQIWLTVVKVVLQWLQIWMVSSSPQAILVNSSDCIICLLQDCCTIKHIHLIYFGFGSLHIRLKFKTTALK